MPDQVSQQLLEVLLAMPKEKRADAFKKIKENGIQISSPEVMQQLNKMFTGEDMYLPNLPGPRTRPPSFDTVYGPTGAREVRNLQTEMDAATQNVENIAKKKERSINPLNWIMSGGKSPVPYATESGSNFLAGAADAAVQTPGDLKTKLLSALVRGATNVAVGGAINAATGREPEAGSAHNITNLIPNFPKIPGGVAGTNAISSGLGEFLDTGDIDKALQAGGISAGATGAMQAAQSLIRGGILAPKSREDLARELYKRRSAPPSAAGSEMVLSKNAQDLANLSPQVLQEIKQYAPESIIRPSPRNAAFDEIIDRTGFNIREMSETEWAFVKKTAKEEPEQIYRRAIEPIFSAKNYSDLESAAKEFNRNVTNVASLMGKDRAFALKGIRNAFINEVFNVNNLKKTKQIINPNSLRYRVEAIGPDMFNQIFSDSPRSKSQASGAYDAFNTILDLAEKGARINKYHDLKVFITNKGPALIKIPLLGSALETPLDQDAMFSGKNKTITALAGAALGAISPGKAATLGAVELGEFSWDKFFETFAKKNSRTLPILKALANQEKTYSQASIERAVQALFDLSEKQEKRKISGEDWPEGTTELK